MIASTDLSDVESAAPWAGAEANVVAGNVEPASGATGQDKQAHFRALYQAHFKLVWGSLRRLGVPEVDAMDLAQKVFFTAYTKLDEFEGRSLITTWLVGICQRVASDHRRSAVVRREVATDASELDARSALMDGSGLASDGAIARDRAALAEAVLNKLPEAQRTVFVLFELEELSGKEIADLLAISEGTVRSRLRLARETFARECRRLSASEREEES